MITIVDYGVGNLGSVVNMLKYLGVNCKVASNPDELDDAEKILLPGVGAFDAAMTRINNNGFRNVLEKKVQTDKIPLLGICLGMQLLTDSSEEGNASGLGWILGRTRRFSFTDNSNLKVPHIGWNYINVTRPSSLVHDLPTDPRFYFVHSYHVECADINDVIATTNYGLEFHSIVQKNNIYGAQFHPEKSHKYGLKLLRNFAEL